NAVTFCISTFIGGIEKFISGDGLLRANFMQTITATGRLSSQRPNLYNQPRGSTFPVKRCFVSRWPEGLLLDVDFSTLEFCVAAELSNDPRAFQDIADKVDVHTRTADILTKAGQPTDRQGAKSHTFKPLYGGLSGTESERTYYKAFLEDYYPQIGSWHRELCDTAHTRGRIRLPSGREYDFSHIVRYNSGHVSHSTQI